MGDESRKFLAERLRLLCPSKAEGPIHLLRSREPPAAGEMRADVDDTRAKKKHGEAQRPASAAATTSFGVVIIMATRIGLAGTASPCRCWRRTPGQRQQRGAGGAVRARTPRTGSSKNKGRLPLRPTRCLRKNCNATPWLNLRRHRIRAHRLHLEHSSPPRRKSAARDSRARSILKSRNREPRTRRGTRQGRRKERALPPAGRCRW